MCSTCFVKAKRTAQIDWLAAPRLPYLDPLSTGLKTDPLSDRKTLQTADSGMFMLRHSNMAKLCPHWMQLAVTLLSIILEMAEVRGTPVALTYITFHTFDPPITAMEDGASCIRPCIINFHCQHLIR